MRSLVRAISSLALLTTMIFAAPSFAGDCLELTATELRAELNDPRHQLPELTSAQLSLAAQIGQHPAFDSLSSQVLTWAAREIDRQRALDPEGLEAHMADIDALLAQMDATGELPTNAYAVFGISPGELEEWHESAQTLAVAFPALASLEEDVATAVLLRAGGEHPAFANLAATATPDMTSTDEGVNACYDGCEMLYAVTLRLLAFQKMAVTFSCIVLGLPLSIPCIDSIPGGYAKALREADKARTECIEACDEATCHDDGDCAANEYCWKGVAGVGDNECRPEKAQGKRCSRHGQCASGCCKLHLFTNPFSKTCRPADKCN